MPIFPSVPLSKNSAPPFISILLFFFFKKLYVYIERLPYIYSLYMFSSRIYIYMVQRIKNKQLILLPIKVLVPCRPLSAGS